MLLPTFSPARGTFRDSSEPPGGSHRGRRFNPNAAPQYDACNHSLVLFDRGHEDVVVRAGDEGIHFLLEYPASRLRSRVAWYGPIVMNTDKQLRQALTELEDGSFIKHR